MTYRTRIKYTSEQKKYMWDRWLKGDSLKDIGRFMKHVTDQNWFTVMLVAPGWNFKG